jgi:hypothetical protein
MDGHFRGGLARRQLADVVDDNPCPQSRGIQRDAFADAAGFSAAAGSGHDDDFSVQ